MIQPTIRVAVSEQSHVGEARRKAAMLSKDAGFNETDAGKIAIIVTEMATNIIKHAVEGYLLFTQLADGLEMLAIDKGPGMVNIGQCLEDGYSTAGSQGTGLGAVARLSDLFDVYSHPSKGTVILSRSFAVKPVSKSGAAVFSLGCICVPYQGETRCGDSWAVHQKDNRIRILVVDGIGHGLLASEAAQEAIRLFNETPDISPIIYADRANSALKATRGAALAILHIDLEKQVCAFAGIGNIAGSILHGQNSRGLASSNGIVGHQFPKVQEMHYPFPSDAMIVMHSDGLNTRWNIGNYPGLKMRDPSIIAAVLFRDHERGRDDATILVGMMRNGSTTHKWI